MQRDGLMDESDNFLTRFGNGNAAGQVGHIGAVVTLGFLDDYHVLHLLKSLYSNGPVEDDDPLPEEVK